MSRRFSVKLGSTDFTPGHKHSCAQVAIEFIVKADDKDEALAIVQDLAKLVRNNPSAPLRQTRGGVRPQVSCGGFEFNGIEMRVSLNADFITKRSATVEEVSS